MQLSSAAIAHLAQRRGVAVRWLFWVEAKDRTTGDIVPLGLWNGSDHREFTVNGVPRTYYGAGSLVQVQPLTYETGPVVRIQTVEFAPISPEVEQMLRGYDARLAPVELHLANFDPQTMELISIDRAFRGVLDKAPIPTPEIGNSSRIVAELASTARRMTRTVTAKKSDEAQKRRAGDRFRRYADVSGSVTVWWGEARAKAPATKPAAETKSEPESDPR